MGQRRKTSGFSIANVLRGRTLRDIIESDTTFKTNCDDCSRSSAWTPAQARNELKFRAFMDKPIEELAAKMSCAGCRSKNLFLTIRPKTSIITNPPDPSTWPKDVPILGTVSADGPEDDK